MKMPSKVLRCGLLLVLLAATATFGKDEKKIDIWQHVDKQKVENAIKSGLAYLLDSIEKGNQLSPSLVPPGVDGLSAEEFVLYTLVKGGVDKEDPNFKKLLEKVLSKKLERTYLVSVLAMALDEIDRVAYQEKIANCAQFLIDNQCKNGQWDYGKPTDPLDSKVFVTPSKPKDGKDSGTVSVKKVQLARRRGKEGPATGDNSNTQYACLALRSCMQASIVIPPEVFQLTAQFLEKKQQADGGWGYDSPHGNQISPAYGSMSVGALGSLIICKFYLTKRIPDRDNSVLKGFDWVIKNFTVTENPKFKQGFWHYYYLYAMERLGAFLETEEFGSNLWYPVGAKFLLEKQEASGSWNQGRIDDTCFAILFLRRATKPLRAKVTGDKE